MGVEGGDGESECSFLVDGRDGGGVISMGMLEWRHKLTGLAEWKLRRSESGRCA